MTVMDSPGWTRGLSIVMSGLCWNGEMRIVNFSRNYNILPLYSNQLIKLLLRL